MKANLIVKVLLTAMFLFPVTQAIAEGTPLAGKWFVLPDGKSKLTILTLTQTGETISGTWTPDKGQPSPIENAKFAGDTLTFSFASGKKEFAATGRIKNGTMMFDISESQWGKVKTTHAQAARAGVD